ncbi:MAG: peroxiredoxin [Burkholderiales bacterium]
MTNQAVNDFSLPATGGGAFELSKSDAPILVLYFYPKDNTPGCTTESLQFRDLHPEFREAGARVYGVSRDSLRSHTSFKAKLKLPFELLADEDETVCQQFGVIKMKNMYGRQVRGIERSTFVLDAGRAVRREWRGVKVPGHAKEVLDFVKTL